MGWRLLSALRPWEHSLHNCTRPDRENAKHSWTKQCPHSRGASRGHQRHLIRQGTRIRWHTCIGHQLNNALHQLCKCAGGVPPRDARFHHHNPVKEQGWPQWLQPLSRHLSPLLASSFPAWHFVALTSLQKECTPSLSLAFDPNVPRMICFSLWDSYKKSAWNNNALFSLPLSTQIKKGSQPSSPQRLFCLSTMQLWCS